MKLALITPFPPIKMAEADHGLRLTEQLAAAGVDVHVLTQVGSVSLSSPHVTVSATMRDWSWREWSRLREFLIETAPDAVLLFFFGPLYGSHPMITFAPWLVQRVIPGVPLVTQISYPIGAAPSTKHWPARLLRKGMALCCGQGVDWAHGTLLRDSRGIIVFSDDHRRELAKLWPPVSNRCSLVPPPPFLTITQDTREHCRRSIRDQFGVADEDVLIEHFLGRVYAGKGLETLMHAFQSALQRKPNLHLLIAGGALDGQAYRAQYLADLRQLADTLGIQRRVSWTGEYSWDSDAGSRYLRAADICALPFDKGVHLNNSSFAAAASHGLPVLSTTGAIPPEPAFVHGENVFLCPPRNPIALAAGIERLVDDVGLRERLRQGVGRMADEWFSWDRAIERTLTLLRRDEPDAVGYGVRGELSTVGETISEVK